jgi:hypothetical protein
MRNPDSQTRRRDSVRGANRAIVASWREHLAPLRPHAIDAGLAVVVAVAIAISVTYEKGSQPPDALAYALGVTIGALVLARRRWPLGVLVASVVALQVYYFANYPGIQPAVALAVALYTAAAAGYLRWSLVIAAWYWVPPYYSLPSGFWDRWYRRSMGSCGTERSWSPCCFSATRCAATAR